MYIHDKFIIIIIIIVIIKQFHFGLDAWVVGVGFRFSALKNCIILETESTCGKKY